MRPSWRSADRHGDLDWPRVRVAGVAGAAASAGPGMSLARLREFVASEYNNGRSLRELAELTGRTQDRFLHLSRDVGGTTGRGLPPGDAPQAERPRA